MDLGIAGKQALVMGASRGLGHECALALAREGVEVAIVARDPERLARAAARLRDETGKPATPVAADFRTRAGRDAALRRVPGARHPGDQCRGLSAGRLPRLFA